MNDFTWSKTEIRRYENEIFGILQSFEKAQEWADLSNCLQRLHRCISKEFGSTSGVPLKETISKRLAQCLNPSLPSGVHIKALETYGCIFEKIGKDELSSDLALYGSGLFPFFVHSSTQIKPIFLDLIERYFLPLGPNLLPCLSGLLVGLLPGLEDSKSEYYERLMKTFQLISNENCVGEKNFMCTLWLVLLRTTQVRYSALEIIMSRFPANNSGEKKIGAAKIQNLIPSTNLFTKALESCFEDENILVKRHLLDFLISHVPLENSGSENDISEKILPIESKVLLLRKALRLFLLKEWSLTRRLIQWIMNNRTTSPINKYEIKIEKSIIKILNTAIIEEFLHSFSIISQLSTSEIEKSVRLLRSQSTRISKQYSNFYTSSQPSSNINISSNILQPLKIVNALFEEYNLCTELVMPKILIPLLVFANKSIKKVPELEISIVEECRYLLTSSKLKPNKFLDSIHSAFSKSLDNLNYEKNSEYSSDILNPSISLLQDVLFFYINNIIKMESSLDFNIFFGLFLMDLLKSIMKIMIDYRLKNENAIILINITLYIIKKFRKLEIKDQIKLDKDFSLVFVLFIKTTFSSIYNALFPKDDLHFRKLIYSLLLELYNTDILKPIILKESESISSDPFKDFPVPQWLFNIYKRCATIDISETSTDILEDYLIEDAFKCLEVTIEILFNSSFLIEGEYISNCWSECMKNIMNLLWNFLDPKFHRLHKESTFLFIKIEKWVQIHFSMLNKQKKIFDDEYLSILFRGNSILSQLFINKLSIYDYDLKILNIKKLSNFVKYSINTIYKIPSEVTFLVLEGLDSNFIQLRLTSSNWIIQAFETPQIIFDHIIQELINSEMVSFFDDKFHFNEEFDPERLLYTIDRLVTLISLENVNTIQIMIDTIVGDSTFMPFILKYNIENYFEMFIFVILSFLINEAPNLQNFRIQCSAANALNTILKKSSLLNNTFISLKKSTYFWDKLNNITFLIVNQILEALQQSILNKRIALQIPIIQLLHTILLIQRSTQNQRVNDLKSHLLLINNDKLFPVIISGLQQIPSVINNTQKSDKLFDEQIEISFSLNNMLSYCLPIRSYIDFCLCIFEEINSDQLVKNVTSILITLSLELSSSIQMDNQIAVLEYFDSILKILLHVIGLPSISNSLFSSKLNLQNNSGFIQSLFNWQKEYNMDNHPKIYFEISSINSIPSLLNYPIESTIENINIESKLSIIKNTILTLFSTLVEVLYCIQEKGIFFNDQSNSSISRIFQYINSISFLLAWNASDAFIFCGIVCWSHNNKPIKMRFNKRTSTSNCDSRNVAIISILQSEYILKFVKATNIFSIIADFLSYHWFHFNECYEVLRNNDILPNINFENKKIPEYIIYFSKISIEKDWIYCCYLWKESLVFHFLYTILVTYSFTKFEEFLLLWKISSSLLNLFLQKVKQPKSVLWFATLLLTLDGCMASSKSPTSTIIDRKLSNIFSERKLIKNLNTLIHMILFLVHENFSLKVFGSVQPQEYDKFPPLPPTIEAMLQSIEFNIIDEGIASADSNCYCEYPKAIVSDDPNLLFSYYSMGFLIMYNIEILCHSNSKKLFLRNIWGTSIVKSLDWAFQPLLKRNNDLGNMIHKYFLLLHMDTFPFKIFPEYLSGIKKSVIDSINSPDFFCMDRRTFRCWLNVVSRLVSSDLSSTSTNARFNIIDTYVPIQSMGIFSTKDAELQNRCAHIKRLAFLIFCCPQNTFQLQLSIILEKLVENLKLAPENPNNSDAINSQFISLAEQVILCLRVLLLKIHYQALMPLWPIVLAELIKIFGSRRNQRLMISAMKFVDLASLLDIPEFHLYQWIFVTDFFNTKECFSEDFRISEIKFETTDSSNLLGENIEKNTNEMKVFNTFSPFCSVISQSEYVNEDQRKLLSGVDMNKLKSIFQNEIFRYPLLHYFAKNESKQNLMEMAKFLDQNCLLNSIQSSQIDHEKLIRSIEDDFLDFPANLLDWGKSTDPISLYSIILNQKSQLRDNCIKHTRIQ